MANLLRTGNGFGYLEFYNYDTDKTTSGWISLNDLAEQGSDHMSE